MLMQHLKEIGDFYRLDLWCGLHENEDNVELYMSKDDTETEPCNMIV